MHTGTLTRDTYLAYGEDHIALVRVPAGTPVTYRPVGPRGTMLAVTADHNGQPATHHVPADRVAPDA